jgi:hypothetical protein
MDKDKLKKLVQIFGDLIKIEGNEWLIDEMIKTISESKTVEEIAKNSIIQNIHEYCVEQKIEKQAKEFYANFPIPEIKLQLIQDYKKMEHERRRDDFENFSLCVFQQIENITNYLFDNFILKNWETNKSEIVIRFPDGNSKTLSSLIMGNTIDWYANNKFKAVIFFYYFNETLKTTVPFNEIVEKFNEVYQMRNKNHRGSNPKDFQQKILDKIKGFESKYYFKFYGFLEDFVNKIEAALTKKIETQKNNLIKVDTLGDNPNFANIFNQLKNIK